jgi:GNAT superfamily N-acetyltransferase
MSTVIQRLAPHEWPTYRALRLRSLAESPDAFGSTLAAERARPDAAWAHRLDAAARAPWDLPLVARVGEAAIGLAWARVDRAEPDVAHLHQVWVAPEHRGRGVGQRLVHAAIEWARAAGARHLALGVACGDGPAARLYTRAGFQACGELTPLRPGSPLMVQPMRLSLQGEIDTPSP